VATRVEYFITG